MSAFSIPEPTSQTAPAIAMPCGANLPLMTYQSGKHMPRRSRRCGFKCEVQHAHLWQAQAAVQTSKARSGINALMRQPAGEVPRRVSALALDGSPQDLVVTVYSFEGDEVPVSGEADPRGSVAAQ